MTARGLGLVDMLETVDEFGSSSLELVAWEFDLPVERMQTLWEYAMGRHLLNAAGENELGEPTFRLSPGARVWLTSDPAPAAHSVSVCVACGELRVVHGRCSCREPQGAAGSGAR